MTRLDYYRKMKRQFPDALLLMRVGDFYEAFDEDALEVGFALKLTVCTMGKNRQNPIPMVGFPCHSSGTYLEMLHNTGKEVQLV